MTNSELVDGHTGRSPVGSFPPNGYGLYDMAGNVWELTSDDWTPRHTGAPPACCTAETARLAARRKVMKGGSYLCAPNYCLRYRPAARQPQATDTTTCHVGFRCVRDLDSIRHRPNTVAAQEGLAGLNW